MHPPRPLALIRPTTGSSAVAQRDRRRDVVTALLRSPILLPPPRPPPPPFGTPTGPLLPLAARLTGPAFRPALPPVSAANPQGERQHPSLRIPRPDRADPADPFLPARFFVLVTFKACDCAVERKTLYKSPVNCCQ